MAQTPQHTWCRMSKRFAIKECFYTMQGEGTHSGRAAVFLRFAGCNLWSGTEDGREHGKGDCAKWCDTDFVGGDKMSADEIADLLDATHPDIAINPITTSRFLVITGGEPTLQVTEALIELLHRRGWTVAIETNGTISNPALRIIDWVCVSPKRGSTLAISDFDEMKVVLPGGWTESELLDLEAKADEAKAMLYAQPQDSPESAGIERCVAWVLNHPRWRLSYQTHKAVGLR
jgi:7-carboxy-7-deazaguanine synthase